MNVEQLVEVLKTEPERVTEMAIEGSHRDFNLFTDGFEPELKAKVLKCWKFTDSSNQ